MPHFRQGTKALRAPRVKKNDGSPSKNWGLQSLNRRWRQANLQLFQKYHPGLGHWIMACCVVGEGHGKGWVLSFLDSEWIL